MSQKKKFAPIRDAFEDPEEQPDIWFTVSVANSSSYKVEELGQKKQTEQITRSNSHPARRKRKQSLALSSDALLKPPPPLFVATASTPTSPYSSPRTSVYNIEPQRLQRADSNNGLPSSTSAPINVLRKSLPANFIPPPPTTPHPSTIRRPSANASPLSTPIGSPNSGAIFSMEDDNLDEPHEQSSAFRVEIMHVIVAQEHDSTSALITRSATTIPKDDLSLRALLHPLLPETWHLRGMQRKNNALYCVERPKPASDRLVYIEETWQVVSEKVVIDNKTFLGKNAILLACAVTSLIASNSPLIFHDKAVDCLSRLYRQAIDDGLNPFIVFMNGKPLKIPLRQQVARHFFSIGFAVHTLHWHGLSNTADCKFTTHLAEKWKE